MFKYHPQCRACGKLQTLVKVADFGPTPLVNDFKSKGDVHAGYAPLEIMVCTHCWMPQLSVVVDPKILYSNYAYQHSAGTTLQKHFDGLINILHDEKPQLGRVLELGSNDGLLLDRLRSLPDVDDVLGCDPAKNLAEVAESRGIRTVTKMFTNNTACEIAGAHAKFDVVIGRHVFAHIDDWLDLFCGLDQVTNQEAIVVLEVPYAPRMLNDCEFDSAYHEHLSYINLRGMEALTARTDVNMAWRMHDCVTSDLHGGSIIMVLRKKTSVVPQLGSIQHMIEHEPIGLSDWYEFRKRAEAMIEELAQVVRWNADRGYQIAGYGAPAKATNWLNACRFTSRDLSFVADNTPYKQWKLMPGTDIQVVPPDRIAERKPDFMVLFAWNFKDEILEKEKAYIASGGKFIIPVPHVHIVP